MEDHYIINIWLEPTKGKNSYPCHYASVRLPSSLSARDATERFYDFVERFPPPTFGLSLTKWEGRGREMARRDHTTELVRA